MTKWRDLYFQELVRLASDKNCSAITAPLLGQRNGLEDNMVLLSLIFLKPSFSENIFNVNISKVQCIRKI